MYTPSHTATNSKAATVTGTSSSKTQGSRSTMGSSRNPYQTPTRTPTRLTEEGLTSVMNGMNLQNRAPHHSLHPQTPANTNMSLAAYHEELGRLRAQIEHKNTLIRQLEYEKRMLDDVNHSMHEQASRDQMALQKADAERTRLMTEITRLNKEKASHQVSLKQLHDQVAKQQKTIKVQSDQIANPNVSKARTPQHVAPIGGFNHIYSQPPPGYNGPHSGPSSAFPPSTPAFATRMSRDPSSALAFAPPMSRDPSSASAFTLPMSRDPSSASAFAPPMSRDPSSASAFGPPMSRQSSAIAFQTSIRSSAMSDNKRIANTPAYPIGNNQQLARVKGTEPISVHLLPEYAPFFNMVENWARGYCNVPDKEKDFALPSSLVQHLKQHTNPSALQKLMSSGGTRYLAVAKVMNQTLVNVAFRPGLLKGFTIYHDKKIADARAQLQPVGMPLHVRRACLVASAQTVMEMTTAQGFKAFLENVVSRQVHEMWACLEPLFAPDIARNEAWDDLYHIWREACRIGMLMMSKPSLFTCEFPPVGSNSSFNPSSMVSRDSTFRQYPQSQMAATIRLSVTPIVTETDFMGTGAMQARTLYCSNVLLDF